METKLGSIFFFTAYFISDFEVNSWGIWLPPNINTSIKFLVIIQHFDVKVCSEIDGGQKQIL
jgi:hypothetical protein